MSRQSKGTKTAQTKDTTENQFIDFVVKPFYMDRSEDVTGTSGIGIVAQGMITSIDDQVFTTWLSETPSFTIHQSLDTAKYIHGHNGKTQFVIAQDILSMPHDLMPLPFALLHTENPCQLSRIGVVGKGVICNSGFTIFRWAVYPFQVEMFTDMEHFNRVHCNKPYATTITLRELAEKS